MARAAWSSLWYSVEAYQPYFAPPVTPQTSYIRGGSPVLTTIDNEGGEFWTQHNRLVNRDPRRLGIRALYSYGAQVYNYFKMVATGQVQSSAFQPRVSHTWTGEFNDALYQAGYPRNTGLTFKVQTVDKRINPPWTMAQAPNFRGRAIYVNQRPVTSGIPGVPAKGSYS